MQTPRMPATRSAVPSIARGRRADPWTLGVLAIMSLLTISTPSVELFGVPRITVLSVPFTLYMLVNIRGKINSDLLCFVFAYLIAFVPSTIFASISGDVRLNSVLQGAMALLTFMVVGTYISDWMTYSSQKIVESGFKILTLLFLGLSVVELIFYKYFLELRFKLYNSDNAFNDIGVILTRELTLYGGRPSGLFSEPSHFARYIGLMMIAYMVATKRSIASLWASGAFIVATRSVSYFFAFPAMLVELGRVMGAYDGATSLSRKKRNGLSFIGPGVVIVVALSGIYYTQSERIDAALGGRANTSSAVTGDTSLNERIVIPAGYFFDGPKNLSFGLGPTPQDEMQEYTLFATRAAYHSRLSSEYKSAVSTSIFTLAGMGYVGVTLLFAVLLQLRGWFGVQMGVSYLAANIFSSGYHSTTSLVPSGLLLGIMSFQHLQARVRTEVQRRNQPEVVQRRNTNLRSVGTPRRSRQ